MQLIQQKISLPEVFSAPLDVQKRQKALIIQSQKIKSVTDAKSQDLAVESARSIRTWVKEVESARMLITKPILETQRLLKSLADEHCAPLIYEQRRVEKLVTVFQEAEALRVQKEEEERQAEFKKAQREKFAAEEAARKEAERLEQLNKTTSLDAIRLERKERIAAEAALAVKQVIATPAPVIQKSSGATTKKVLRWEVADLNALVKARPELCKIEVKPSAIQALCVPEMPVPGLRLWWENQTLIRGY